MVDDFPQKSVSADIFDQLMALAPELRESRIDALGLPDDEADWLRTQIAFEELTDLPIDQYQARVAESKLAESARVTLHAMLVFQHVLALEPELRGAKLAEMTLPAEVRHRVDTMLKSESQMTGLRRVIAKDSMRILTEEDDAALGHSLIGTRVGAFLLIASIGKGGSSSVFRAERDAGEGKQLVALKLLRNGLYSGDAQRRFRREQAILAQLTHPNIARLIESGVTAMGIPYIAMELVEGEPITLAANHKQLTFEQRLELFVKLCRTIEVAHRALIVHRDLKPSNIFVTHEGELKVLDFGIAKLLEGGCDATRAIMLTPEYAAPEQFTCAPLTTAVDTHALGVILGELLTGHRLDRSLPASIAVKTKQTGDDAPSSWALPPHLLIQYLRGDLDAILANATAKDSRLRHRGADALADDIERYLAGKPVLAHPSSH
jgi:serine/threonine-protein kinase